MNCPRDPLSVLGIIFHKWSMCEAKMNYSVKNIAARSGSAFPYHSLTQCSTKKLYRGESGTCDMSSKYCEAVPRNQGTKDKKH